MLNVEQIHGKISQDSLTYNLWEKVIAIVIIEDFLTQLV